METFLAFPPLPLLLLGACLAAIVGGLLFFAVSKKIREGELAKLRKLYEEMQPTDPEYNQVRALYLSMGLGATGISGVIGGLAGSFDSSGDSTAGGSDGGGGSD